jgi:lysyl oxidase
MRPARRSALAIVLALLTLATVSGVTPAGAANPPSLRLFAAADQLTVQASRRGFVYLDPGLWVTPVGGAFELRAFRPDYDTPVSLTQTDAATGDALRTLSTDLLDGWSGMKDFIHLALRDADGKLVFRYPATFCPNLWGRARVSDEGPLTSNYPMFCGGNPFTKGMVYGIDAGWAVPAASNYGYPSLGFRARDKRYRLTAWIDPAWVDALGIAPEDASATVHITIGRSNDGSKPGTAPSAAGPAQYTPASDVPETTSPPADTLPDLVALPAWGIGTYSRKGHDYLTFNATEWDGGPGTMVVEGFRPQNAAEMNAFQYFLRDGEAVARAPVGFLEFHESHQHWHFEQFTQYSLIDSAGNVQYSGKRSWCLANTDPLDLTVPNANWQAYGGDIFTFCGGAGAIWIREVLDVGWGDTYGQYIPGQAFDITDLPNGTYTVRVQVNPAGLLYEGDMTNDTADREIHLKGRPGDRRVIVPPWHGIDTESFCPYCG